MERFQFIKRDSARIHGGTFQEVGRKRTKIAKKKSRDGAAPLMMMRAFYS